MKKISEIAINLIQIFEERFGHTPRVFSSPGRINLIGEHTDYNGGFVLPAGVDKAVYFALSKRNDDRIVLYAADLDRTYECDKNDLSQPAEAWAVFQLGILDQLQKNGLHYGGFQAVFGGDVPLGAGMSSSAALECCLIFALNQLFSLGLSTLQMVKLAQKAENEYVGLKCGIMDQFASAFAREAEVIRLDCRSLEYAYFPFPMQEYAIALCDTGVKHALADSAYNKRREECESGVRILQQYYPEATHLRDLTPQQVALHREELGPIRYQRCKYITEENSRVLEACDLLVKGDLKGFGRRMYQSHAGLQHEYDVSCEELDFLVEQTVENQEVLGSRMMGGGFGGCTINLVARTYLDQFEEQMKSAYWNKFERALQVYRVKIENGTTELLL